jgi:hypothetical protein
VAVFKKLIIIDKTVLFESAFLRKFCHIASGFHFFGFHDSYFFFFLQSKFVGLASNLEVQVPVFMSPGDRVAQLYPQAGSILKPSFHLLLGLHSGLFPSGFTSKILYTLIFFPMHAPFPLHLIPFALIILIIFSEEYKLCGFLQLPVILSPR